MWTWASDENKNSACDFGGKNLLNRGHLDNKLGDGKIRQGTVTGTEVLQMYSDDLIPELPKTAHSCRRDGPATAWLPSERPGNVMPVPKISTLLRS